MKQLDLLASYLDKSNAITIAVLIVLSLYFIFINWIFFYRFFRLMTLIRNENFSMESMQIGDKKPVVQSFLYKCLVEPTKVYADLCITKVTKESTKGLTGLSIVASTSPFIGLFGTVVSILETFYVMGSTKASIATISASIGEALVATAAGIFVAIFAYTYHLLLKRKAYELVTAVQMQIDLMLGG